MTAQRMRARRAQRGRVHSQLFAPHHVEPDWRDVIAAGIVLEVLRHTGEPLNVTEARHRRAAIRHERGDVAPAALRLLGL